MGNCASKPRKHRDSGASNDAIDALTKQFHPDVDGKGRHLHMHATKSGRMLLGQDVAPMSDEHKEQMKTVLEEDPEAAEKAKGLMNAVNMGLQVASSGSPAFSGLLVARVISASIKELKNPAVQLAVEDDKSHPILHNSGRRKSGDEAQLPTLDEPQESDLPDPGSGTGPLADGATPGEQNLNRQATGVKVREFTWDSNTALPFVVVFSHAAVTVTLRDRVLASLQPVVAQGSIAVSDLPQGKSTQTLTMKKGGKELGVVTLEIDYTWLRDTRDDGGRISTTQIRINNRKLPSPMAVISHVSNVNHWLLSHDNVWAALPKDHPELRKNKKGADGALDSVTASDYGSKAELLKLPSSTEGDSVTDGSSDVSPSQRAMKHIIDEAIADVEGHQAASTGYGKMFQFACTDALENKAADCETTCEFKSQLASLFSLMNQRLSSLEDQVAQQQQVIMDLSYQISAKDTGPVLPYISGKFGYGLGRPAAKRKVLLFANRGQYAPTEDKYDTMFLGQFTTDSNGTLGPVHVPESMSTTPGHYNVLALLPQDNTFARGSLFILEPKTKCVLFDLDGTVTTGDDQVVAQFALNAFAASTDVGDRLLTQAWDQKSRAHARTLCRLWAAKGYQVVYLSGRQGSFYNLTQQWLSKHFFPPGPIHLTRTHVPTMPLYVSVGNFKLNYMEGLKKKGFELFAAYGNTGTDVRAYEAAGIPKSRTFTIGQAAGFGGTQRVKNWTYHMKDVLAFPEASIPIPYVDLLACSVPSYHRGKANKPGSRQNLASATSGVMPSKQNSNPYNGKEEFRLSSVSSDDTENEIAHVLEAVELDCEQVADMYDDGDYDNDLEPEATGSAPASTNAQVNGGNIQTPVAVEDVKPVDQSDAQAPVAAEAVAETTAPTAIA